MNPSLLSVLRVSAVTAVLGFGAPAAAQMPTQIQFLDSMMRPITRAGMVTPARPIRALDAMGMAVPNTTIRFSWSPICGGMPPYDVMTDSMGMAMTPPFATGIVSGTCTVTMELLASMMQTMYMVEVYNTPDIVVMRAPGGMINAMTGNTFLFGISASVRGYALPNVPVTFSVSSPGMANVSSLTPMSAMTDAMGAVMASAMANSMAGTYQINASVDGAMAMWVVSQTASSMMPPPPSPQVQVTRQASGASPAGTGPITVSLFNSPCTFAASSFMGMQAASVPSPPPGIAFPHGLVSLRLDSCGTGQSVTMAIDYPEQVPPTAAFWRYGPTADDSTSHWYRVPAEIESHRLRVTLTDGAMGDDDMMRNGSIGVLGGVGLPGGVLQDLWWSGNAESGWGMSMVQHRDVLFAVIYAYDSAGRPTWYAMPGGQWNASRMVYTGALYQPRGTPYFQYDAAHLSVGPALGTATLTFMDASNAMLDYTIGGVSGRKSIVRQIYGATDLSDHGSHADMWWGGSAQNGWGVAMMQQYASLFTVWFTYDANGSPTWFVMPGGTWTSSDTYEGRMYRTTSSPWVGVAYDPARLQVTDAGAFRLRLNGDSPTLDYTLDGRTGTLRLSHQPF
jgi:hypothetical protein